MDKHIKVHDICCNCVFFATEFCFDIQGCNQKKGKHGLSGSWIRVWYSIHANTTNIWAIKWITYLNQSSVKLFHRGSHSYVTENIFSLMKYSIFYAKKAFGSRWKENLSLEDILQTCFCFKTLKNPGRLSGLLLGNIGRPCPKQFLSGKLILHFQMV